jgi:hypothetical protein
VQPAFPYDQKLAGVAENSAASAFPERRFRKAASEHADSLDADRSAASAS